MWPFKPAWMSSNHLKATKAVERIRNQNTLKKIALSDYLVQFEAVGQISDQNILKEIALSGVSIPLRDKVLSRIRDQDILKEIATGATSGSLRTLALGRIQDKIFLRDRLEHELLDEEKLQICTALEMHEEATRLKDAIRLRDDLRLFDIVKETWLLLRQDSARDAISKIHSSAVLKEVVLFLDRVAAKRNLEYFAISCIKDLKMLNELV
jgi:hypothetical protein